MTRVVKEFVSNETRYCKSNDFEANEYGVYIYISANGKHSIDLPSILYDYKEGVLYELEEEARDNVQGEMEYLRKKSRDEKLNTTSLEGSMKYDWLLENFDKITLDQLKSLIP